MKRVVMSLVILMSASAFVASPAQTPPAQSAATPSQAPAVESAATPSQAPAAQSAAAPSQAPPTSTAAGASSQNAATTASAAPQKAETEIPKGYKRKMLNGEERFCRSDSVTGSRTQRTEVCLTRAQIDERNRNSQDYLEQVQRSGGIVTGQGASMGAAGGH
jgi:hypothetical protein